MTNSQRSIINAAQAGAAASNRFTHACAQGWVPPAEGGLPLERSLEAWEHEQALMRAAATLQWPSPVVTSAVADALTAFTLRWKEDGHGDLQQDEQMRYGGTMIRIQDKTPLKGDQVLMAIGSTRAEALANWIVQRWKLAGSNDPALGLLTSIYRVD
jgi:hypothetical protein